MYSLSSCIKRGRFLFCFVFFQAFQGSQPSSFAAEESSRMDLDTETLVDAENNIKTTARLAFRFKVLAA